MANLHETIDSLNDDNAAEVKEQLKTGADELHKSNKQLYARAKKAEGFEFKDNKWVKKPEKKPIEPKKPKEPEAKKSDESDYAIKLSQKAFLNSKGITNTDDQEYLFRESKLLNRNPEDILDMEHVKTHLKKTKTQREAEDGMPSDGGKKGGGTKGSVEYWIDRKKKDGTFETPSDPTLAKKVIDARIKQEKDKGMFSDNTFTG